MQAWAWIELNPDGTVDVDVSDDPAKPDRRHIGRARIKHLREYGMLLEDADATVTIWEKKVRDAAGLTDELRDRVLALQGKSIDELDTVEVMNLPDGQAIYNDYQRRLQQFILGPDNPYPALYRTLLSDGALVDQPLELSETDDLPLWCLGQEGLKLIVEHWQSVPFIPGLGAQATPQPANRAARRAGTKKTT